MTCLRYIMLLLVLESNSTKLLIMTLNTWQCGGNVQNGLAKIVKVIMENSADIVALQEINSAQCFTNILQKLGSKWHGVKRMNGKFPDTAVVSKYKFDSGSVEEFSYAVGAKFMIPVERSAIQLTVISAHFQYLSYGPYAACNKLVTEKWQISAAEHSPNHTGRVFNVKAMAKMKLLANSTKKTRVIVAGDFNTPSHQDWTENVAHIHCNWSYDWPVTKIAVNQLGLIDSFRKIYPDNAKTPGNTWSPTHKKYVNYGDFGLAIPEPQDRVDFIFYKGQGLTPTKSYVFEGKSDLKEYLPYQYHPNEPMPLPNHFNNEYPSDHGAVVTEFEIIVK